MVVGAQMSKGNHTYYFIRYPLAAGGTHLSNLISLDASFAPKVNGMSKDDYISYLIDFYNLPSPIAHLTSQHIISDAVWVDYIEELDYSFTNSVHSGHAASFDWTNQILTTLTNKIFISVTVNEEESINILRNRERKIFDSDTFQNDYSRSELQHFYTQWFKSDNPNVVDDDINLTVELVELHQNISTVLERINNKFNLSIPIDLAVTLHKKWLSKN